jgi:hypothetical protein
LCFGLDLEEQERSGFRYGYSVYQAEYSRNLLFASGAQMEALFDRVLDRTGSRLDIPAIRTIFGLKLKQKRNNAQISAELFSDPQNIVTKAKELLRMTSLRSADIAYQVGYNDPHYFSSVFKKNTGVSPIEFRLQV